MRHEKSSCATEDQPNSPDCQFCDLKFLQELNFVVHGTGPGFTLCAVRPEQIIKSGPKQNFIWGPSRICATQIKPCLWTKQVVNIFNTIDTVLLYFYILTVLQMKNIQMSI